MSLMSVAELGAAVSAQAVRGPGGIVFSSVSTDTRTLEAGALFVARRGERFDGHDYAQAAVDRGAVALLVSGRSGPTCRRSLLPDSKRALGIGAPYPASRISNLESQNTLGPKR